MPILKNPKKSIFLLFHIFMILVMAFVLFSLTMEINNMKDTSRVINYTGLVRGTSQRMVKRELTGIPSDDLISSLDSWLAQLNGNPGPDNLIYLADPEYRQSLTTLTTKWTALKTAVLLYRQDGNRQLLNPISESFFEQANQTAGNAETYAATQARHLVQMEVILAVIICILFIEVLLRTAKEFGLLQKNASLNKLAYIDVDTMLPNRTACATFIEEHSVPEKFKNHGCIMFDLNNLKVINDTLGHEFGNLAIINFAHALNICLPMYAFAGRWGGDEFIVVFEQINETGIINYINAVQDKIDIYNKDHPEMTISFAHGYSLSNNNEALNLKGHLIIADSNMYECKRQMKASH